MKPRLPRELERLLPSAILHYLYSFVPPIQTPKLSPSLQKELVKIQSCKGTVSMYMKHLDDFVLD